jgi:hypothetical protein
MDGEWEAPMIANPEFKGEWAAKKIENPAYKGEWVQAEKANPAYVAELPSAQSMMDRIGQVAIDVTANTDGVTIDDIFIVNAADGVEQATAEAESNWGVQMAAWFETAKAAAVKAAAEAEAMAESNFPSIPWGGALSGLALYGFMYTQVWN